MNKRSREMSLGQSLIEAVVIVGLVIILVTGLVVSATSSLRGAQTVRERSKAIAYANEGIELARKLRDNDWDTFYSYGVDPSTGIGTTQCLDDEGIWTLQGTVACEVPNVEHYTRYVIFDWHMFENRMKVTVSVTWEDGSIPRTITSATYFTKWQ